MSKNVEIFDTKSEINENGNVSAQELQEYSNLLKQRAQMYREENTKMEEIFKNLKLLNDELKLIGLGSCVENLDKFLSESESKKLSCDNIILGQADKLRKQSNYVAKLKICIRHYSNINSTILKEIKSLKSELEQSKQNLNNTLKLSIQDIQQLDEKAKKYENELTKLEKKYPWLKNSEYDLPNISKYVDVLNSLKEEKNSLVKELSMYKNLKPDIKEAKQQLAELKDQMKSDAVNFKTILAPATLNGQNVILSQEQQRKIYDTLNTAIIGNNFGINTISPGNINVLHAQKQFFPGGVTFSFAHQQPQHVSGMCCKCPSVPNPVTFDNNINSGMNTFFPSTRENQMFSGTQPCGLDYFNYQQQASRNPFQLKFHSDHGTSSSDLLSHVTQVPASQGYPDLCNINGALQQNQVVSDSSQMSNNAPVFFPLPPVEFSSNAKKLVLSKIVAPCDHVVDALDVNEKDEIKKRVSFSDDHSDSPARIEKSCQISSDCICEAKKCKNRPKKTKKQKKDDQSSTDEENIQEKSEKKKKKKKQKGYNTASSDTTVSSDSERKSDFEEPKKRWWNKHSRTAQSDTCDTEQSKVNAKEKKENKKRKKDNNPCNNLSVDTDDQQNMSDSSNQQSSTSEQSLSEGN